MPQRSASDSPTFPGRDRRRHPRAQADWPLELKLGAVPVQARLRDVSRSGLCFFLDRPVPEMTVLGLTVAVPEDNTAVPQSGSGGSASDAGTLTSPVDSGQMRSVSTRGVVVRCDKISENLDHYEVAVFFHQIDKRDAEAIDELVRKFGQQD